MAGPLTTAIFIDATCIATTIIIDAAYRRLGPCLRLNRRLWSWTKLTLIILVWTRFRNVLRQQYTSPWPAPPSLSPSTPFSTTLGSLIRSRIMTMTTTKTFGTRIVGAKNSLDYRVYLEDDQGKVISPFHDIPLWADADVSKGLVNMICEIPRFTNAKLEISKDEFMNPIKQDVKKGKLRFVHNCFPFHGYMWNYGALPQTWESPKDIDESTKCRGDNDPLDVIEIGGAIMKTGQVKTVKVLGVMALLDEGETDWKIIAIDLDDPLASKLNDVADIEIHCPGLLDATRQWFKLYKIPDGKPPNQFAFDGQAKDKSFAIKVIEHTFSTWKQLISGAVPSECDEYKIDTRNRSQDSYNVSDESGMPPKHAEKPDNQAPETVDSWAFIPENLK